MRKNKSLSSLVSVVAVLLFFQAFGQNDVPLGLNPSSQFIPSLEGINPDKMYQIEDNKWISGKDLIEREKNGRGYGDSPGLPAGSHFNSPWYQQAGKQTQCPDPADGQLLENMHPHGFIQNSSKSASADPLKTEKQAQEALSPQADPKVVGRPDYTETQVELSVAAEASRRQNLNAPGGDLDRVGSSSRAVEAGGPLEASSLRNLDNLSSLGQAMDVQAKQKQGVDLVRAAVDYQKIVRDSNRKDEEVLSDFYQEAPLGEIRQRLQRSKEYNSNLVEILSSAINQGSELSRDDRVRFAMAARQAVQKIEAAEALLSEAENQGLSRLNLFNPQANAAGKSSEVIDTLNELFGGNSQNEIDVQDPTSVEALVDRYIKFGGLSNSERGQALKNLNLAEMLELKVKGKKETQKLLALHNGYLFGAKKTGVDCSSLISELLGIGQITTADLRNIWEYRRKGIFARPPVYTDQRKEWIQKLALNFIAVDPYRDEMIRPGDLIFSRFRDRTAGHVVIVKSYDRPNLRAQIIEASQTAGTVRERSFELSLTPKERNIRFLRPGLWVLRFKDDSFSGGKCSVKTAGR